MEELKKVKQPSLGLCFHDEVVHFIILNNLQGAYFKVITSLLLFNLMILSN